MSGFVYADRGQNSLFASNNAECPMKKLLRFLSIVLLLAVAALFLERPAYAYADPGTGLLAIQAVGSALVATGCDSYSVNTAAPGNYVIQVTGTGASTNAQQYQDVSLTITK